MSIPYDASKWSDRNQSGGGGRADLFVKIVIGVVLGLVVVCRVGGLILSCAGLSSRRDLESILRERVKLHEELASILANVKDVRSARTASQVANEKFRAITKNLRKIRAKKGSESDLDTLKQQYASSQIQAWQRVMAEIHRISTLDDVGEALAVQAAVEELDREEAEISGTIPPPFPAQSKAPFITPDP